MTRSANVVVDRTLGGVVVEPAAISPNGDGQNERLRVGFELTRSANVRVEIRRAGKVIRTVLSGVPRHGRLRSLLGRAACRAARGPPTGP